MDTLNTTHLRTLENFVCGFPLKKLPELFNSSYHGVSVFPVWFESVVEGVDMWFNEHETINYYLYSFYVK
jgi:hypothetical protein